MNKRSKIEIIYIICLFQFVGKFNTIMIHYQENLLMSIKRRMISIQKFPPMK